MQRRQSKNGLERVKTQLPTNKLELQVLTLLLLLLFRLELTQHDVKG